MWATPPERDPDVADSAARREVERRRDRDKGEGVGRAVTHLAVGGPGGEGQCRQLHCADQLAVLEHCVALRLVAGQPVQVHQRDAPLAGGAEHDDDGIQRDHGDGSACESTG